MVKKKENLRNAFPEVSTIFSNPAVDPEKDILHIYAPVDSIDDKEKRKKYIYENKDNIKNIIMEVL